MIKIYIVDAFTDKPFKGNVAGIGWLDAPIDESAMQSMAFELGFSETAFVHPMDGGYAIRFFTPNTEIPLCGHTTLAAAKVFFEHHPQKTSVKFINIQSVNLEVFLDNGFLNMVFPRYSVQRHLFSSSVLDSLGVSAIEHSAICLDSQMGLIELDSVEKLRELTPDIMALERSTHEIKGMVVTARSTDFDYELRFFGPWVGIPEDPVTGSIQSFLAPYWSAKLNKKEMKVHQCSLRGGLLGLKVMPDAVVISGQAVMVFRGDWLVHSPNKMDDDL